MGFCDNPTIHFNVLPENLLDFADFLSMINTATGLVGFDMDDFKSSVSGCNTVYFRTNSGNELSKATNELCDILKPYPKALCVITANELPKDGETPKSYDLAKSMKQTKSTIRPQVFFWNVYEVEQSDKYKIYVLCGD